MTTAERVQKIHDQAIVIDGLTGSAMCYEEILAGGINAVNATIDSHAGMQSVIFDAHQYYAHMELHSEKIRFVQEAEDIPTAKNEGKLGIIFGLQDPYPLEENTRTVPATLYTLWKMGIRIIQLSYNDANALGCGCTEPNDTGLTSVGQMVVQIMNKLGMLVDLSHVGNRTGRDATELSEEPVALTHANPLALLDKARNKPDDLIRLVAEKGGVVGVTPYASFCKSAPGQRPTMEDFLDTLDYVVQLIGIDHVGVGTDKFEGRTELQYYTDFQSRYPKLMVPFEHRHVVGFSTISNWPSITEGLIRRGYSDEDCGKILGGNFFSLFKKIWKTHPF
jgi:membrane dipeptidase